MRILLVSHWLPPVETGSSFYAANVGQSIMERGHEVLGVTMDWGEQLDPAPHVPFPVRCLPVFRTPGINVFYRLELMGFSNRRANRRTMREIARRFRPDVVHHVNHIFDSIFLSRLAARESNAPLVGSITTPIQHERPLLNRLMRMGDRVLIGHGAIRHWDAVISLDATVHRYVGETYGTEAMERSVIIPFGARIGSTAEYIQPMQKENRPQILMVGHMHPFRNPVMLVRAMKLIVKRIPTARLVLVGRMDIEEPARVALSLGLTHDQVVIRGFVPHDEVVSLYKKSHVFAYWITGPYRSLGTASIEALACGTPVVTDLPVDLFGAGRLRPDENIVIVDSRDPANIARAIIGLIEDPARRERIGAAGRAFVEEELSWSSISARIEALYCRVLRTAREKRSGGR